MINTPLPRRKTRWRMMLLCVALLIGGGLIGASAATLYLLHRVTEAFDHPEQIPARMAARLHRRLEPVARPNQRHRNDPTEPAGQP